MLRNRPPVDKELAEKARMLRNHMTDEEKKLWYQYLSPCRFSVKRQYIIAPFIVDFYCAEANLVIEIDGIQHFDEAAKLYDKRRTQYLNTFGLQVVRFTNRQIHEQFRDICMFLENLMQKRTLIDFQKSNSGEPPSTGRGQGDRVEFHEL